MLSKALRKTFYKSAPHFIKHLFSNNKEFVYQLTHADSSELDDLHIQFKDSFIQYTLNQYSDIFDQLSLYHQYADLRNPHTNHPHKIPRHITFHAGPTNSGKTWSSIQALEKSQSGIYLGPLRLLALEIYQTLNHKGVLTSLVTGQEKHILKKAQHLSCTVEMGPVTEVASSESQTSKSPLYDVAVIDEIQMLGDQERGAAWTRALLGLDAHNIHLCGDPAALQIVENLVQDTGDSLSVIKYNRLSPLDIAPESLYGNLSLIQPGDAVIAFSRKACHQLVFDIETVTNLKCSIVYGNLPPNVRREQTKLFNSGQTQVLVATDAIAMGLNLEISRVVFSTMEKKEKSKIVPLSPMLVRQIAGRAGRYKSKYPNGLVTVLQENDFGYLQQCMNTSYNSLSRAGISPTYNQLVQFSNNCQQPGKYPPKLIFDVLEQYQNVVLLESKYFLQNLEDFKLRNQQAKRLLMKLDWIDQWNLLSVPFNIKNKVCLNVFLEIARILATNEPVSIFDLVQLDRRLLDQAKGVSVSVNNSFHNQHGALKTKIGAQSGPQLLSWEDLHHILTAYIWLSQKYPSSNGSFDRFPNTHLCRQLLIANSSNIQHSLTQNERKVDFRVQFDQKPKRDKTGIGPATGRGSFNKSTIHFASRVGIRDMLDSFDPKTSSHQSSLHFGSEMEDIFHQVRAKVKKTKAAPNATPSSLKSQKRHKSRPSRPRKKWQF